jgi:hypothetical protein
MGRAFGFLAMLMVVGIGAYVYMQQVQTVSPVTTLNTSIEITGVRNDLLAIANAERRYWISNGKYAQLDELSASGDVHIPSRDTYIYSVDFTDNGFRVIATYSGSDPKAPKLITVDENLRMSTN